MMIVKEKKDKLMILFKIGMTGCLGGLIIMTCLIVICSIFTPGIIIPVNEPEVWGWSTIFFVFVSGFVLVAIAIGLILMGIYLFYIAWLKKK